MNYLVNLAVLASFLALAACGGGASDDNEAPTPVAPEPQESAGSLVFSAPTYIAQESNGVSARVLVQRVGGTRGIVGAFVSLGAGTATAVDDFGTEDLEVRFGDGDDSARLVILPIVHDDIDEPDETLTLRLHSPLGCASIGTQNTAEVTIIDDDEVSTASLEYTIGGTVSGLAGSGLVLTNVSTDALSITANGAFAFPREYRDGFLYRVRVDTQPTSPNQSCTVTNGEGTVSGGPVTNITVNCESVTLPSGLDSTFGTNGRVTSGLTAGITDLALAADGKLIVVGGDSLARYNADGSLDTTFGTNGVAAVGIHGPSYDRLEAVAVQADGRIVVAGYSRNGNNSPTQEDVIVARFLANGSLDTNFGTNGRVITDIANRGDAAYDVLLPVDGTIVITGTLTILDQFGLADSNFGVLRYTSSGVLDTSFGTGGYTTTNVAGRADIGYAAALQSNGRIIVAGRVANSGGASPDVGLVRYLANGALDTSFGSNGIVRIQTPDADEAADVIVQSTGDIVVAGHLVESSEATSLLARFNEDGSVDTTFGNAGRVVSAVITVARSLTSQVNGDLIVGGWRPRTSTDFAIARFSASGTLDATFGTQGLMAVDFFGASDVVNTVAVQSDGRIVAAGSAVNGTATRMGLARFIP